MSSRAVGPLAPHRSRGGALTRRRDRPLCEVRSYWKGAVIGSLMPCPLVFFCGAKTAPTTAATLRHRNGPAVDTTPRSLPRNAAPQGVTAHEVRSRVGASPRARATSRAGLFAVRSLQHSRARSQELSARGRGSQGDGRRRCVRRPPAPYSPGGRVEAWYVVGDAPRCVLARWDRFGSPPAPRSVRATRRRRMPRTRRQPRRGLTRPRAREAVRLTDASSAAASAASVAAFGRTKDHTRDTAGSSFRSRNLFSVSRCRGAVWASRRSSIDADGFTCHSGGSKFCGRFARGIHELPRIVEWVAIASITRSMVVVNESSMSSGRPKPPRSSISTKP